jgi:hypothetical protein
MTIKVNGVSIEVQDGAKITVEPNGNIVIDCGGVEHHHHYYPLPAITIPAGGPNQPPFVPYIGDLRGLSNGQTAPLLGTFIGGCILGSGNYN